MENIVMEYAQKRFDMEQSELNNSNSEIEQGEQISDVTNQEVNTEIVSQEAQGLKQDDLSTTPTNPVDFNKFIFENSDGIFNDVDSFKSALPKIKEYDELVKSKQELEAKVNVKPFANEFIETIDSMVRSGKSNDEIYNFVKISRTDISALSDEEVKIMSYVNKGYSPEVAKAKFNRDFPFENYDEDSTDYAILKDELRLSTIEDRKNLEAYKKDLTKFDDTNKIEAQKEAERLEFEQQSKKIEHANKVKTVLPEILSSIKGLGSIEFKDKDGNVVNKSEFEYDEDYKKDLNAKLESYFLDYNVEVTQENIDIAKSHIKAVYLEKNFDKIAQDIFLNAMSIAQKEKDKEYQNLSGLPTETLPPVNTSVDKDYYNALERIAKGR